MKRSNALGILGALTFSLGTADATRAEPSPPGPGSEDVAGVVGREVAAFNAHDAAGVTKLHAPDATFALLPSGKVLAQGSDALTAFFTKYFTDHPAARLTLEKQYVLKNVVVNNYAGAAGGSGSLSIYEVADGVIANEWLILG